MDMKEKYGLLLNGNNIKIHRQYFKEMVRLIGVQTIYRAPRPSKSWTTYAEIDSNYFNPILVGCIFDEHPTQRTLKKMGWVSELQDSSSIIHVPYDLDGLQKGALFIIPSGLDDGKGRIFRVETISNIMVYPASIACEIVPEYENTFSDSAYNHANDSFNLLHREE